VKEPADLITPEAVVVRLPLAGIGSRLIAALLDMAIQTAAVTILFISSMAAARSHPTVVFVLVPIYLFLIMLGSPIAMETFLRGKTVGKMAMGLRVVRDDGSPITFRAAAVRGVLRVLEANPVTYPVGVMAILLSRKAKRLGDMAAGTIVVRERAPAPPPPLMVVVPSGLEQLASTLDTTTLSDRDYQLIREFLLRRDRFDLEARNSLALKFADHYARKLGAQVPPGTWPEAFLMAVAAAHQYRSNRAWMTYPQPYPPSR